MAYDKRYKRRHAARRFGRLRLKRGSAAFPESGGILMYQQEYERWLAAELEDKDLKPELLSIQGIDAEIQDRFAVELEFGTAGLRGVLGAGTNRMNIYMVRKATQGLANYLNKQGGKKSVAISYDSRIKSDVFAREAARVLAGNGVKAYLYKEMMPVPALSFATRHLHCDAGIMVTASHNPAKYNGYKAYGPDGCQITLEAADEGRNEYTVRVACSKGTYVRTLCADIGERLGCGAALTSLRRTRSGVFTLADARTLDDFQRLREAGALDTALLPVERLFEGLPRVAVEGRREFLLRHGACVPVFSGVPEEGLFRVYGAGDAFLMLGAVRADKEGRPAIFCEKNFCTAE